MLPLLIETIADIFMALLSTWVLKSYFGIFFKNKNKSILIWLIYFLWQWISTSGILDLPIYLNIVLSISIVFLAGFAFECNIAQKFIMGVMYNSLWILLEFIIGYIFISFNWDYQKMDFWGSLISKLFLFLLVQALSRFFQNESISELPRQYNIILMLIPLGSIYVVYDMFTMSTALYSGINVMETYASTIVMLLINVVIFHLIITLSRKFELEKKNYIYRQEIEYYTQYIKEKQSTINSIRRLKHDLKNQLIYLDKLIKIKDYNKMSQFMKEFNAENYFYNGNIAKTGNVLVDAIINNKYTITQKEDIDFKIQLDIPDSLPYSDVDLCLILGNALDNAIEANARSKIKDKYISLFMKYDMGNLIIVLENSFDGKIIRDQNGKIITSKKEKSSHGMGISSIKISAEKYHGLVKNEITDSKYVLKVVLYQEKLHGNSES